MTDPFKKDQHGRHTRKVQRVLETIDGFLDGCAVMPCQLPLDPETVDQVIDPDYDGAPHYRGIPITIIDDSTKGESVG